MNRICSYCPKDMGEKPPLQDKRTSHGICPGYQRNITNELIWNALLEGDMKSAVALTQIKEGSDEYDAVIEAARAGIYGKSDPVVLREKLFFVLGVLAEKCRVKDSTIKRLLNELEQFRVNSGR